MNFKHSGTRRLVAVVMAAAGSATVGALAALPGVASAAQVQTITVQSGPGAPGTPDPNVQASADGTTWNQAFTVASNPRYSTIPGTSWDSIAANGIEGAGNFYYQAQINLPDNAANPTLSGEYYSDNQGAVSVNGTQVAENNPCGGVGEGEDYGFQGAPTTAFSSPLTAGENTLSFAVNNCLPSATGVDFTATASFTLYPTTTGQCKKGGWKALTDRFGTSFKNQGDCVSYVATDGRNLAG
jgi:hypothetical protein